MARTLVHPFQALSRTSSAARTTTWRTIILYTSLVLIYQDVFSGVSRFVFSSMRMVLLQYLPGIAVTMLILAHIFFQGIIVRRLTYYIIFLIVILAFAYSLTMGRSLPSASFAFYTWGGFFVGFITVEQRCFKDILRHVPILWCIAVAGVLLNAKITFPWFGAEYEILGTHVETARGWGTFGIDRLSGFSRSSAVVANQIAVFIVVLATLKLGRVTKIFAWGLSLIAISLTTSKTPLTCVALAPALIYGYGKLQSSPVLRRLTLLPYIIVTLCLLEAAVIIPPFVMTGSELSNTDFEPPKELPFLKMESLVDRAQNMWPGAFALMHVDHADDTIFLFGRGIGGISAGQTLRDDEDLNAADNIFIFIWVTFGLFGTLIFFGFIFIGWRRRIDDLSEGTEIFYALSVAVLMLGTLTSVIESIVPAVALGAIVAKAIFQPPKERFPRIASHSSCTNSSF